MSCPTYSGKRLTIAQAKAIAQQAGFSGPSLDIFVAIEQAESGLDLGAISCSNDRGIAQINDVHGVPQSCWSDPLCSAQFSYQLSNGGQNFSPWSTFNNGAYLAFLPQTQTTTPDSGMSDNLCVQRTGSGPSDYTFVPANQDGSCPQGTLPSSVFPGAVTGPRGPFGGLSLPNFNIVSVLEPDWLKGPLNTLSDLGNLTKGAFSAGSKLFAFFTNPKSWLRILAAIGALALIGIGAYFLLSGGHTTNINLQQASQATEVAG